jgi:transitional endoplasmic reticulum ATPase
MFNATIKNEDKCYQKITQCLLEETISRKSPSVSQKDIKEYERVRNEFSPKDEKKKDVRIGFHV